MANSQQVESMPRLLELANFRVRGNQADCARCSGRSRGTVSFTAEVAFCHRCGWTGNRIVLSRELGLLSTDPVTRLAMRRERERRETLEAPIRMFEAWRDEQLWCVTDRYRRLSRQAVLAESVLKNYADCEPGWEALARFYHEEAQLSMALDWLTFTKVSIWLEEDSTVSQVFDAWRSHAA